MAGKEWHMHVHSWRDHFDAGHALARKLTAYARPGTVVHQRQQAAGYASSRPERRPAVLATSLIRSLSMRRIREVASTGFLGFTKSSLHHLYHFGTTFRLKWFFNFGAC